MSAIKTSAELAELLLAKARDAAEGKGNYISGADSLCRCAETVIKLARLEMDFQLKMQQAQPSKQIEQKPVWLEMDVTNIDSASVDDLKAALKSGEDHLAEIEVMADTLNDEKPRHPAIKVLRAEATYIRAYLLAIRDAIEEGRS